MAEYAFLSKTIITVEDVKKSVASESAVFSALKRLVDSGKIVKLKGGMYATVNPLTKDIFANRYEIASALYENVYVGYHTALEYYGISTQMYSDVHVLSETRYNSMVIEDLEYQFYKSNYNSGIITAKQNTIIRITELERTVIDCIDRIDIAGGIEEVFMALIAIKYCDEKKLIQHLQGYNKKNLYKKVGCLFSYIKPKYLSDNFYKICHDNMSHREDDIRENKLVAYIYDKEWKIYLPKHIYNTEN